MNFKSLIIGLGNIGFKYDNSLTDETVMTHARALKLHPFFDLVGAVELDQGNRNIFEASYHKPTFSSIKEALIKTKPSLIVLATPSRSHADLLDDIL